MKCGNVQNDDHKKIMKCSECGSMDLKDITPKDMIINNEEEVEVVND